MVRVDLFVHRNRLIGSPAVVSSRIFSNRSRTSGSTSSTLFLPPPARLARPSPGLTSFPPPLNSSTALVIVVRESPVNAATRLMPPHPQIQRFIRGKQPRLKLIQRAEYLQPSPFASRNRPTARGPDHSPQNTLSSNICSTYCLTLTKPKDSPARCQRSFGNNRGRLTKRNIK
jgi:hypothetical protein